MISAKGAHEAIQKMIEQKESGGMSHSQIANVFNKEHGLNGKQRLQPTLVKKLLKGVASKHEEKHQKERAHFESLFDDLTDQSKGGSDDNES